MNWLKNNYKGVLIIISISINFIIGIALVKNNYGNDKNIENCLDSIGADTTINTRVLSFEYGEYVSNGKSYKHKYLEFLRDNQSYLIHDPSCQCEINILSNKLNNITEVINKVTDEKINKLDINNRKNFRIIIDKITDIDKKTKPQIKYITKTIYSKPKKK